MRRGLGASDGAGLEASAKNSAPTSVLLAGMRTTECRARRNMRASGSCSSRVAKGTVTFQDDLHADLLGDVPAGDQTKKASARHIH